MSKLKKITIGLSVFLLSFTISSLFYNYNSTDITKNSVMVVNKAMNSGGTGIILKSSKDGSYVLTNSHVCRLIKKAGGLVRTATSTYQAESILESKVSDLCLVYVPANLKQNTKLANHEPETFSAAKVSGHPALMPTSITTGHFSERSIIQVMSGIRPCTEQEAGDPDTAMVCMFFNGIPVVKSFESVLVTATIMPGSSGSGVYNSKDELSGVVFAGAGDFGYAWTVPYDQVNAFLNVEAKEGLFEDLDQTVQMFNKKDDSKTIREILQQCQKVEDPKILSMCNLMKKDVVWVK